MTVTGWNWTGHLADPACQSMGRNWCSITINNWSRFNSWLAYGQEKNRFYYIIIYSSYLTYEQIWHPKLDNSRLVGGGSRFDQFN